MRNTAYRYRHWPMLLITGLMLAFATVLPSNALGYSPTTDDNALYDASDGMIMDALMSSTVFVVSEPVALPPDLRARHYTMEQPAYPLPRARAQVTHRPTYAGGIRVAVLE